MLEINCKDWGTMKIRINNTLISKLKPKTHYYNIMDTELPGFHVRISPTGRATYRCNYKRGKTYTIGKTSYITPAQARDKAKQVLGNAAMGIDPEDKTTSNIIPTLEQFIENQYGPWKKAHRKNGQRDIKRLERLFFAKYGKSPINEIKAIKIDMWRTERLNDGINPATINRDMNIFKAALSKAVEWEIIDTNPLQSLKPLKTDNQAKIRYLTPEELSRLYQALNERQQDRSDARDNANIWRGERSYQQLPQLTEDYLKTMIIVSLNTGVRRGELFNLTWINVNFEQALITIEGSGTKSGKTRHIPLNKDALNALLHWKQQACDDTSFVFPGTNNNPITTVKKAWKNLLNKAQIENFRWHDMRHHFASWLVMRGVDLNTARELLGHGDIKMTLRYAHLTPEHKAEAVARLVQD